MADLKVLIEKFKPEAINFEKYVPYMYLDNFGYLTIGIGHLISKLNGHNVQALVDSLSNQPAEKLIPMSDIISDTDLNILLQRDGTIKTALDEVQKLQFSILKVSQEKDVISNMSSAENIPPTKFAETVKKAFLEMLKQSIKLKAMLKKNPQFRGYVHSSFFNTTRHLGPNNLIISDTTINNLFIQDTTKKINELESKFSIAFYQSTLSRMQIVNKSGTSTFPDWYRKNFGKEPIYGSWKGYDDFPEPVQLALLDMAYNLGAQGLITKFPYFCQLVREEKWTEVLKPDYMGKPSYYRSGQAFELRNKQVGEKIQSVVNPLKGPGVP